MPVRHRSSNPQPHPAVLPHLWRFETPDMAQFGGCPQEALGTSQDTVANCGLRLTHQTENLAWPGTQKKKSPTFWWVGGLQLPQVFGTFVVHLCLLRWVQVDGARLAVHRGTALTFLWLGRCRFLWRRNCNYNFFTGDSDEESVMKKFFSKVHG